MCCLNGTKTNNGTDEEEKNDNDIQDRCFVYRFGVNFTLLCNIINKRTQFTHTDENVETAKIRK